jgi:hypothetical protein
MTQLQSITTLATLDKVLTAIYIFFSERECRQQKHYRIATLLEAPLVAGSTET